MTCRVPENPVTYDTVFGQIVVHLTMQESWPCYMYACLQQSVTKHL